MAKRQTDAHLQDAGQLALLDRVISAVGQARGFARGIEEILAVTMTALHFEAGAVVLIDEDGRTARLACQQGMPDEIVRRFSEFRVDEPPYDAVTRGEPMLRSTENGDRVLAGFACIATVPLGAGDGVFGALGLASCTSRDLSAELVTVLLAIGREAGELVKRARAEEEVRRLNVELEATVAERTKALETANRALLAEIDERRRAEEELRGSEQRYVRMFDHDPDALLVIDSETQRILDANEAASRMYGFAREELLGFSIADLCAEPAATCEAVSAVGGAATTLVPLGRHRRRNGDAFPVEIAASTIELAGRTLITYALRDVTERERRAGYTSAVAEIQRRLLSADDMLSPKELYGLILPPLLEATRADRVYVFQNRLDDQGRVLADQLAELVRPGITAQIDNPRLQGQLFGALGAEWFELLRSGSPVMGHTAEFPESVRSSFEEEGIRSLLVLPLMVHGDLSGYIGFDNCSDERLWDFSEVALLTTAATALSAALERRLAFETLRGTTVELAALLRASRAIASSIDYDEVLREVARAAGEALGSPQCIIWEHTAVGERAEFRCLWEREPQPGLAESLRGASYDITSHSGGMRTLRAGTVVQESLSNPGLRARDREDMERYGEKTWLTVPLVAADVLIGVMILIETEEERDFGADEVRLAGAIGEQAAVALSNARLHRRQEERNRWLGTLVEAGRVVASTLDADELLTSVARLAAEAVLAKAAFIYEYDAERDVIVTRSSYRAEDVGRDDPIGNVFSVSDAPDDRRALEKGEVFVETLSDPDLDDFVRREMIEWGEKTLVNVPFRFQGEALGMLVLIETEAERAYTPDELEYLSAFGEQVALALNNARLYATIEAQATMDGLTGLANHRTFYERLAQELARGRRYGSPVSLLMLDIDDFKVLNDTYGHPAGDEVLRLLGRVLTEQLRRDVDLPARYGGEEFAVILPNTSTSPGPPGGETGDGPGEDAEALAERLRAVIAARAFPVGGSGPARITVSIGIATWPAMAQNMDDLVARADAALYAAKRAGKDRVAVCRA
jgi:diguanylate cyclase (GGDEF)-like protein/PAS domain S-box-containing protein